MTFEETYLNDNILDALYDMHFEQMTPIQEKCIPEILDGYDVLGVAQTGTGKTAAYLLPILSLLDDGLGDEQSSTPHPCYPEDAINCVVMAPTRELAQQIDQAMQGFSYYVPNVSSIAVYGGNDGIRFDQETKGLRGGAPVVIATPGRLLSHLKMGNLDLSRTSFFVLDEADRMLDMGFSEDIMQINALLPKDCQKVMFSATMPDKIRQLAVSLLHDPVEVKIAVSKPAEKIQQSAYVCYDPQKLKIIQHLFRGGDLQRVIIFCGKKDRVKEIARELKKMNINCAPMHSDLSQAERDDVMYRFKAGQVDVLVATDIVSRGIDIDDILMVMNYDVPHDCEDYVHRIGRTARAERDGVAITLINEKDIPLFKDIERFLEKTIEKRPLPEDIGEGPDYSKGSARRSGGGGRGGRGRGRGGKGRGGKGRGQSGQTAQPSQAAQSPQTAQAPQPSPEKKKRTHRGGRHRKRGKGAAEGNNQQPEQQS
ncbi:MAG: DEAD/DEAH box helicase [Prevotella sp.]|nr:DEAD/DEAH box helicase [Prevotella sp.]